MKKLFASLILINYVNLNRYNHSSNTAVLLYRGTYSIKCLFFKPKSAVKYHDLTRFFQKKNTLEVKKSHFPIFVLIWSSYNAIFLQHSFSESQKNALKEEYLIDLIFKNCVAQRGARTHDPEIKSLS